MKKLYIQQKVFKITDHYPILDEDQKRVYQVDQDFKLIGHTVHVSDDRGQEVFLVEKELLTLLPKFKVSFADGKAVFLKSKFTLFKKEINVEGEGLSLSMKGDFFDFNFSLYDQDTLIGSIQKVFLSWGDTYELTIVDESQQDLIVAMMIAVDCIKDAEQRRR